MKIETTSLVAKRIPPGDNWEVVIDLTDAETDVFPSLTDTLNAIYQTTKDTEFYIDARKGKIWTVTNNIPPPPEKKYSLYDED